MSYELHLLKTIIDSPTPDVDTKKVLEAGKIFITHGKKFDWMLEFYSQYKKFPSYEAFYKKYGMELPVVNDPINYYIDKSKESAIFHSVSDVYEALGDFLKNGNGKDAASLIQAKALELASGITYGQDVDYALTIEDRIAEYLRRQNCPEVYGIPCGWDVLDNYTTGWLPATYTVLFSKSKSYKTWILLQWALHAWRQGYSVLLFSREMNAPQLYKRVDALCTNTPYNYFRHGFPNIDEFNKFSDKLRTEVAKPSSTFTVMDQTGIDDKPEIEYLYNKVSLLKPDIVFIDGIYLIQGKGNAEWERIKYVSNQIKQMALRLNIPVVGTTQATRDSKSKSLGKGDVGGTVAFEQDCDLLLAINRILDPVNEILSNELIIKSIASRDGEDLELKVTPDFDEMYFRAEANVAPVVLDNTDYETPF